MTWHIPVWFKGTSSKTPFASFNRWRFWPGVLFCCVYAPQVLALIALAFVPPERVAVWMLRISDSMGPQSQYTKGLLTAGIMIVCLYGPAIPILMLARFSRNRRLERLRGRCMNCGDIRLSEFLDDCSKCGSQFKDQDQFRAVATAKMLRRRPAGIRAPVVELQRSRRAAIVVTILTVMLLIGTAVWMDRAEEGMRPPIPMSLPRASFILSIFAVALPVIQLSISDFKKLKHNLIRLKGSCIECEKPLEDADIICRQCGLSVLAQQLWVRGNLMQRQGLNGPQVKEIAEALGIPFPIGVNKP